MTFKILCPNSTLIRSTVFDSNEYISRIISESSNESKEFDVSKLNDFFQSTGRFSIVFDMFDFIEILWHNVCQNFEDKTVFRKLFLDFSQLFNALDSEIIGEIYYIRLIKLFEVILFDLESLKEKLSKFVTKQQILTINSHLKELKTLQKVIEEQNIIKYNEISKIPAILPPDKKFSKYQFAFEVIKNLNVTKKLKSRNILVFSAESNEIRAIDFSLMINEARKLLNNSCRGESELLSIIRAPLSVPSFVCSLIIESVDGLIDPNVVCEIENCIAPIFEAFLFAQKMGQAKALKAESFMTLSSIITLMSLVKDSFPSLQPILTFFSKENLLLPNEDVNGMLVHLYIYTRQLLQSPFIPDDLYEKPEFFMFNNEYSEFISKCINGQPKDILNELSKKKEYEKIHKFIFHLSALRDLNDILKHGDELVFSDYQKRQLIDLFANSFKEQNSLTKRCIERISRKIPTESMMNEIIAIINQSTEDSLTENAPILMSKLDSLYLNNSKRFNKEELLNELFTNPEINFTEHVEIQEDYISCFSNAHSELVHGICSKSFVSFSNSIKEIKKANEMMVNKYCEMFINNAFELEKEILCSDSKVSLILLALKVSLESLNSLTGNQYDFLLLKLKECIKCFDSYAFHAKVNELLSSIPEFHLENRETFALIEEQTKSRQTKNYLLELFQNAYKSMNYNDFVKLSIALSVGRYETNEANIAVNVLRFVSLSRALKEAVGSPVAVFNVSPIIEMTVEEKPLEQHELNPFEFHFMKRKEKIYRKSKFDVDLDEIDADYESENAKFEETFGDCSDALRNIISKL